MKNWKMELTAGEKSLVEKKIQRDIFQGYVLSALLQWCHSITFWENALWAAILQKQHVKKINHFIFMDNIKLYAKNEMN